MRKLKYRSKDKITRKIDKYSHILFKIKKGKTLDDVKRLLRGRDYFGSMMVENGDADCMLSGYSKSYHGVLFFDKINWKSQVC